MSDTPFGTRINSRQFAGKPKLISAVNSLQQALHETGLSGDRDIIYQLNFLLCDRVTIDQIVCVEEIVRRAAEHR
jgi:hypothetical protein